MRCPLCGKTRGYYAPVTNPHEPCGQCRNILENAGKGITMLVRSLLGRLAELGERVEHLEGELLKPGGHAKDCQCAECEDR